MHSALAVALLTAALVHPSAAVFRAQSLETLKAALQQCLRESQEGDCVDMARKPDGNGGTMGAVGNWDVSHITSMERLFDGAPWSTTSFKLNQYFNQDISLWDVSQVTNMNRMFTYAKNFNQDISDWDVSRVVNMQGMFYHAEDFNQDISDWDVSRVRDMRLMFDQAISFNQDLSSWFVEPTFHKYQSKSSLQLRRSSWSAQGVLCSVSNHSASFSCLSHTDLPPTSSSAPPLSHIKCLSLLASTSTCAGITGSTLGAIHYIVAILTWQDL